jgi:hypothetical protein
MTWELKYKNINQTFSQWGLNHLKRLCINQACDYVWFDAVRANIQESLFGIQDIVQIFNDQTCWFYGVITQVPALMHSHSETLQYKVSGPWWFLENLVYQQLWQGINNKQFFKSRVILGQTQEGDLLKSGEQIKAILQYAIESKVPLQIGNIELGTYIPFEECKDLTCAEAIQRMLRWMPDSTSWFDYTTLPYPTLHIQRRKTLIPITLDLNSKDSIQSLSIQPRPDLQVNGITLKYEKKHYESNFVWSTLEVDKYPSEITEHTIKGVVLTIELEGGHYNYISQKIVTELILPEQAEWWKRHLPVLNGIHTESIIIKEVKRQSTLPYELTKGAIASWMHEAVEEDYIQALISYETQWETVVNRPIALRLYATNGTSHTYKKLISAFPEEPTPQGLAKVLYESLNELQFEGSLRLISLEAISSINMSNTLNLQGGHSWWVGMNATIQSIVETVDTGCTTIQFGPPKHLGADDFIEILRLNRRRKSATHASIRKTGHYPAQGILEQPLYTRVEHGGMGAGNYQKLHLQSEDNLNKKISIDINQLNEGNKIEFREEYVCENGKIKRRMILASETYQNDEDNAAPSEEEYVEEISESDSESDTDSDS